MGGKRGIWRECDKAYHCRASTHFKSRGAWGVSAAFGANATKRIIAARPPISNQGGHGG